MPMILQLLFFQEKNKKPLQKQLRNEVPLNNDIEKTVMSTANTVYRGKTLKVARISVKEVP